jgi:C-terminal binding protein
VVLDGVADVTHEIVDTLDGLDKRLAPYDALISWPTVPLLRPVLSELKKCVGIVRAAVGFDNIDTEFAAQISIPVANIPDYGTEEVADHTLTLLLALSRNLLTLVHATGDGAWDWRVMGPVQRLRGRRLGIIGMGRIGTAVSRRAEAFGLDVGFYDPYIPIGIEKALGLCRFASLHDLLSVSDIITVHVPLSTENRHIISGPEFRRMKDGAILLNTSRGSTVDEAALVEALAEGRLGPVGLDVLEGEPNIHPALRKSQKVLLTAHSAFYSENSLVELRTKSAEFITRLLRGEVEPRIVNNISPRPSTDECLQSR